MTVLFRASASGDILGGDDGLFFDDTRHLSRWVLHVDGVRPVPLSASGGESVLVPAVRRGAPPPFAVFRVQAADEVGLAESLRIVNHTSSDLRLVVSYEAAADFADQFELRTDAVYDKPGTLAASGMRFGYRRDWFVRETVVSCSPSSDNLQWTAEIPAGGDWVLRVHVGRSDAVPRPAPSVAASNAASIEAFVSAASPADTGWALLDRCVAQGLRDLATLRIPVPGASMDPLQASRERPEPRIVAAGAPWFLTLFGRDSILASYFALPYAPALARDVLRALARFAGPDGRILHELRVGELAVFGQVPFARSYATVDATPLFLVLLAATGDAALAKELEQPARAALGWICERLDRDGYLTYPTDEPGLRNQCWKDSSTSICFPDGTPADGPIAVCEAQGYAYDALVRCAALARGAWSDAALATSLDERAGRLRARFLRDFCFDDFVALALDGAGRPVPTIASNPGHLLWSGLLDDERATAVGRRLVASDLFNGWGIRTLAAGQPAYHPLSYHNGSVWPHDTAIAVAGLARYGLHDEARAVASGLLAAASSSGGGLPELIAGYGRDERSSPVPYPHSCSPQAWAAAAPLLLRSALQGGSPY